MNLQSANPAWQLARPISRSSNRRRGTVLLVVAVIVMLLSLAAYQFMLTMQTEHLAAAITGDRIQAQQAAYSARDLLMMMLESPRSDRDKMGGLDDNPLYFGGDPTVLNAGMDGSSALGGSSLGLSGGTSSVESSLSTTGSGEFGDSLLPTIAFGTIAYAMPPTADGSLIGESRSTSSFGTSANAYGSSANAMSTASSTSSLTGTAFGPPTRYGAKNESAKLHLLKLLEWEAANEGAGVTALMSLPGMDPGTADSIMDWLDEDDEPRGGGAESEFYSMLTRPLIPRNALPPDLDELLFVRGVDPWRLFGLPNESNSMMPQTLGTNATDYSATRQSGFGPSASQSTGAIGQASFGNSSASGSILQLGPSPIRPWSEFLTVYSAERNETYTGSPRLFLNGKKLEDLHQQLLENFPLEIANFLVLYRQFGPTKSANDDGNEESETVAPTDANQSADSVTITFDLEAKFVIENPLDLLGTTITVPAPEDADKEKTIALPSPFGDSVDEMAPEFIDLLDKTTIQPDQRLVGRINVNVAPPEVLMTLPSMTETIVEAIMGDRVEQDKNRDRAQEPSNNRQHPIWLLTEGIVDLNVMRQIWPHVTCGGDVYHAEVWGYVDDRSPTVRFETVLDASLKPCRPVYYRELSAPKKSIQIKAPKELIAASAGNERNFAGGEAGLSGRIRGESR